MNLENIQKETVKILSYFDTFCRQHNLRYSLAYGTLLGAVRHQGYIPWDDDVDVYMPREDYEKFLDLYSMEKQKYWLQTNTTDKNYYLSFAKLRNTNISLREVAFENIDVQEGPWIDIFPCDYIIEKSVKDQYKQVRRYSDYIRKMIFVHPKDTDGFIVQTIKRNIKKINDSLYQKNKLLRYFYDKREQSIVKYNNETFDSIVTFSLVPNSYSEFVKTIMPKQIFDNLIEIEFEGKKYFAFKNYDQVLKQVYGNYMELPPLEQRVSNHDFL